MLVLFQCSSPQTCMEVVISAFPYTLSTLQVMFTSAVSLSKSKDNTVCSRKISFAFWSILFLICLMRRSSVPLLVTLVAVMVKFGCGRGSFLSVHCIVTPHSKDSSLSMQKFAPIGYTRLWLGRSVCTLL